MPRSFIAKDSTGKEHRLYVSGEPPGAGPQAKVRVAPVPRIITADGYSVLRIAKGHYQVIQTSLIVRCEDPDCP
jgi:hypothetical protein